MEDTLEGFEQFWQVYPRKVAKLAAMRMYKRALKLTSPAAILQAAQRYASERRGNDPKFTAHPATWLNAGRWEDETMQQGVERNGNSVLAAADRLIDQLGGMEAARSYVPGSAGPETLSLDFGPSKTGVRLLPKG